MASYHPKVNDDGKPVLLNKPSQPTSIETWVRLEEVASAVPDSPMPEALNGIPFEAWVNVPESNNEWNNVPGQAHIEEPDFRAPLGKMEAAGVVIEEGDGRVWLVSPSNRYGGYVNTFPKGRVDKGVNLQATAIREAYEESGLKVEITGFFADSDRSQSYTRYYRARRVGGTPSAMGWESQAVHLVPKEKLGEFLTNKNDLPLLKAILDASSAIEGPGQIANNVDGNLVRMREAIRSFKYQFGHWPSTLALGTETMKSIQGHLTPFGYSKLTNRITVVAQLKHHLILAADENGNQFDYAVDEPAQTDERVTNRDVDIWLWSVAL